MSISKWRYTEECNGRPCQGDCDHCSFEPGDLISRADAIEAVIAQRHKAELSDYNFALGLAEDAIRHLPSAETHEIRTETHGVCLISKDDAVETVCRTRCGDKAKGCPAHSCLVIEEFDALPSAEANPTVVRCKTMIPYGDFREWAKRIREDNPNVIVIPFDAEVASAEAVQGYTEWLEKIIVDAETFEWLCEDTNDKEWCEDNCHYSSIQAECLRHLYEVDNSGADVEAVQGRIR